jgi:hypothetical protein
MYVPEDDDVDVDRHRVFRERPLGIKGSGLDASVDDGDDAVHHRDDYEESSPFNALKLNLPPLHGTALAQPQKLPPKQRAAHAIRPAPLPARLRHSICLATVLRASPAYEPTGPASIQNPAPISNNWLPFL